MGPIHSQPVQTKETTIDQLASSCVTSRRSGGGADSPGPLRPHASGSPEPPARGEEFRSLDPAADGVGHCRRREVARLAVEPALAPGWGLRWSMPCRERDSSRSSRNRRSHSVSSRLVTWPVGCEEEGRHKLHQPGGRSCMQRIGSFTAVPPSLVGGSPSYRTLPEPKNGGRLER